MLAIKNFFPNTLWSAACFSICFFIGSHAHADMREINTIGNIYETSSYAYFKAPQLDSVIGAGCSISGAPAGTLYNIQVAKTASNEGFLTVLRSLSVSALGVSVNMVMDIELAGAVSCDPLFLPYPTRIIVKE